MDKYTTFMWLPNDFIWLVITVYLEARDQPAVGQQYVAKIILNRAKRRKWKLKDITLARKQFSCWNKGIDHPSTDILETSIFAEVYSNCVAAAIDWLNGSDIMGATHYFNIDLMPDKKPPYWAKKLTYITTIKNHQFYREDKW